MAHVEGDIEEVDGVLRITQIRIAYQMKIPRGTQETVDRVLKVYSDKCPAYQSIKGCIQCEWTMKAEEED